MLTDDDLSHIREKLDSDETWPYKYLGEAALPARIPDAIVRDLLRHIDDVNPGQERQLADELAEAVFYLLEARTPANERTARITFERYRAARQVEYLKTREPRDRG